MGPRLGEIMVRPWAELVGRGLCTGRPTYGTANLDDKHNLCARVVGHPLHFVLIKLVDEDLGSELTPNLFSCIKASSSNCDGHASPPWH